VFAENVVPRLIPCQVATTYGTGLFKGDPVKRLSDGSVAQAAAASDSIFRRHCRGQVPQRRREPGRERLRARVDGVHAGLDAHHRLRHPGDPVHDFEVDANDGTTITTLANGRLLPWENCDHIFTTTGNLVTGMSGVQLNISGHATTALQWRILDISPLASGNDVTQTLAKYLVICNKTQNWPGVFSTTGI